MPKIKTRSNQSSSRLLSKRGVGRGKVGRFVYSKLSDEKQYEPPVVSEKESESEVKSEAPRVIRQLVVQRGIDGRFTRTSKDSEANCEKYKVDLTKYKYDKNDRVDCRGHRPEMQPPLFKQPNFKGAYSKCSKHNARQKRQQGSSKHEESKTDEDVTFRVLEHLHMSQ
ncbi:hypothetical protein SARC_06585 [Sphaeroforma arctica JP610]|uniref:Uncharacterized protein n=1 Tax=Sphaeroforma arctica JP610 TaxID=667725 RepID=A0A0L0FW92_9EUKA|nr:hypothetical protein SARC_06585 [Sphaeroforma arctica JP610]KNC81082.1 hypothetical protein SARC_06585 [Sphaeroforma arctica JP610]|eukprot:XP_014154984.1 hypothetical protein SARC_06585 [Sphaeroforma arctica JP610]